MLEEETNKQIERMELRRLKRERKLKQKPNNQNLNFTLNKIEPLTENQRLTFEAYDQGKHLLLIGSSGTGKTYLSVYLSMKEVLETKQYERLVIVRSVVPSKEMGFLPGSVKDKIRAFECPYQQIFSDLFNRDDAYEYLKNKKVVEFISTSFLRGITFEDALVIVDEVQNLEYNELYAIITRIGKNTKILFCGDYAQTDLKSLHKTDMRKNDILKFIEILKQVPHFKIIKFTHADIVRSPLVKSFIIAAEKYEASIEIEASMGICLHG